MYIGIIFAILEAVAWYKRKTLYPKFVAFGLRYLSIFIRKMSTGELSLGGFKSISIGIAMFLKMAKYYIAAYIYRRAPEYHNGKYGVANMGNKCYTFNNIDKCAKSIFKGDVKNYWLAFVDDCGCYVDITPHESVSTVPIFSDMVILMKPGKFKLGCVGDAIEVEKFFGTELECSELIQAARKDFGSVMRF